MLVVVFFVEGKKKKMSHRAKKNRFLPVGCFWVREKAKK